MPFKDGIWVVTPTQDYLASIRASLDAKIGQALDYIGTVDAAWTLAAAEIAFGIDQNIADVLSYINTNTAPREVLVSRLRGIGIEPRAATFSRVRVFKNGVGVIPLDTLVHTSTTIVPPFGPNIVDPLGRWKVVDNDNDNPADLAVITLESTTAGQVTAGSPTAIFTLVNPIPGITNLEYDENEGSTRTLGRPEETTPELRSRFAVGRIGTGGSTPAMLQAIQNLDWVVAASVSGSGGEIFISVAPGPTGNDQETELAQVIYDNSPPGDWMGTESKVITGADGLPVTIHWSIGDDEEVEVELTFSPSSFDGTVAPAEVQAAVQANIQASFARLKPGKPAIYYRIYAQAITDGLVDFDMTLNGTTDDVYPSNATNVLVPVFV